ARVDERLEGRAGLALRLHGAVELAATEVVAADHRLHLAGVRVDRGQRALHLRLLIEREARLAADRLLGDRDRDHVARLEGARREPPRAPPQGGRRESALLPRRWEAWPLPRPARHPPPARA